MKEQYNFSKAVKNPHIDKLKDGYSVTVHNDFQKSGVWDDVEEDDPLPDEIAAFEEYRNGN